MSLLTKKISNLFYSLFPEQCLHCKALLGNGEENLCFSCYSKLPLYQASWVSPEKNLITEQLKHRVNQINFAASYFYYEEDGIPQTLIHHLKYRGFKNIGKWIENNFFDANNTLFFRPMDVIIPVPLHPKKRKERGYNQVDSLCKALSKRWDIEIDNQSVIRDVYTNSQTQKSKMGRMNNMKGVFCVNSHQNFYQKNVLIVDDVLTTGATIQAIAQEIEEYQPKSINVLVLAIVV